MKTCKNCHYYTGIQCHGHGDYWGECKKNKNTLFCYDDSPCLQDIKTLREVYFKQNNEIIILQSKAMENDAYKTRYEIKCNTLDIYKKLYHNALQYIDKNKTKEFWKETWRILRREK